MKDNVPSTIYPWENNTSPEVTVFLYTARKYTVMNVPMYDKFL